MTVFQQKMLLSLKQHRITLNSKQKRYLSSYQQKNDSQALIIQLKAMDAKRQNCSPINKLIKRSSYAAELQIEHNLRKTTLQNSRKQLTYSTFLDINDDRSPFTPTTDHLQTKHLQLSPRNQQVSINQSKLVRARSLKMIADHKQVVQTVGDKINNDLTQNTLRLRIEEMTFKYKNKINCLLKEINVSNEELGKFTILNKTDEILNFLAIKVREKIVKSQINLTNVMSQSFKSKQVKIQYQVQRQVLGQKLQEKQNIEKQLRIKLRDSHSQARDLLNKVAQKDKEISSKMDQLYQQKALLNEQQKLISRLQATCDSLQRINKESINQLSTQSKDRLSANKALQEQIGKLNSLIDQFKDQISQYKQKQFKLLEINKQLNDELTRWRERYQDQGTSKQQNEKSESEDAIVPLSPNISNRSLKISTMSMNNYGFAQHQARNSRFSTTSQDIENMRLITKVQQLQKKNKQLSRDILNSATIKQRYQQTLAVVGEQPCELAQGLDTNKMQHYKQNYIELYKLQLEDHYKKKLEEVAKDWKNKLYEIVHQYENQLQLAKEQTQRITQQKEELGRKIMMLANQKCVVETKLIQKDRQLYQVTKNLSSNNINYQKKSAKNNNASHSIILSEPQIKTTSHTENAQFQNENHTLKQINVNTQSQIQSKVEMEEKVGNWK